MNGTNYNESLWADFMAVEYDMELSNETYGYQEQSLNIISIFIKKSKKAIKFIFQLC